MILTSHAYTMEKPHKCGVFPLIHFMHTYIIRNRTYTLDAFRSSLARLLPRCSTLYSLATRQHIAPQTASKYVNPTEINLFNQHICKAYGYTK